MKITALGKSVLFAFVDGTTKDGQFNTNRNGSIIVMKDDLDDQSKPRWGKVLSTGPEVIDDIKPGTFILIGALRWTTGLEYEGQKFWKTTDDEVLAVSDSMVNEY